MFTGIIQAVGRVAALEPRGGDLRLVVDAADLWAKIGAQRFADGESIAVSGVCLTAIDARDGRFAADVSRETLDLTTLGTLAPGSPVNLEAALRAGDPLGGHIVSGHVDGLATVVDLREDARSLRVSIEAPPALSRFIAPKGSVALDGVSLTVNAVDDCVFGVNLIPHTVQVTTFGALRTGLKLNLEIDPIARYVQRMLGLG
jgi:riboflavin synthase